MNNIRILFVSLSILVGLVLNAQHLKFKGIPIDGSISTFQTQLLTKGCQVSNYNKELPLGVRGFDGKFAGKDCEIYVWYDVQTKEVYQVGAVIDCDSSVESARNTVEYFKNLLNKKYEGVSVSSEMVENSSLGTLDFEMAIFHPSVDIGSKIIGDICINVGQDDYVPYNYFVSITYVDKENKKKHETNLLNDL